MSDDLEIENRIDDRRRALRHLNRAVADLELAGCVSVRRRLETLRDELLEMTPGKPGPRKWRNNSARAAGANDNAAAEELAARLQARANGW